MEKPSRKRKRNEKEEKKKENVGKVVKKRKLEMEEANYFKKLVQIFSLESQDVIKELKSLSCDVSLERNFAISNICTKYESELKKSSEYCAPFLLIEYVVQIHEVRMGQHLELFGEFERKYRDSITLELFVTPVLLIESGNTYERDSIVKHLQQRHTDPISNREITDTTWYENQELKRIITDQKESFREKGKFLAKNILSFLKGVLAIRGRFKQESLPKCVRWHFFESVVEKSFALVDKILYYYPENIEILTVEENLLSFLKNNAKIFKKIELRVKQIGAKRLKMSHILTKRGKNVAAMKILINKLLKKKIMLKETFELIVKIINADKKILKEKNIFQEALVPIIVHCKANKKENIARSILESIMKKETYKEGVKMTSLLLSVTTDVKERSKLLFTMGGLYSNKKDFKNALSSYRKSLREFPCKETYERLLEILIRDEKENLKEIVQKSIEFVQIVRDIEEKEKILMYIKKLDGDNKIVVKLLANVYILKNDYESLNKIVKENEIDMSNLFFNHFDYQNKKIIELEEKLDAQKLRMDVFEGEYLPIPHMQDNQQFLVKCENKVFEGEEVKILNEDNEFDMQWSLIFKKKLNVKGGANNISVFLQFNSEVYEVEAGFSFTNGENKYEDVRSFSSKSSKWGKKDFTTQEKLNKEDLLVEVTTLKVTKMRSSEKVIHLGDNEDGEQESDNETSSSSSSSDDDDDDEYDIELDLDEIINDLDLNGILDDFF